MRTRTSTLLNLVSALGLVFGSFVSHAIATEHTVKKDATVATAKEADRTVSSEKVEKRKPYRHRGSLNREI